MAMDGAFHAPVMLFEAIDGLHIQADGFYLDGTFGRGGHSLAILQSLGPSGHLLALDKDLSAVQSEQALVLAKDERFEIAHSSYANLFSQIERRGLLGQVSGILLDLGVSSPQLDQAERGFSFMRDGPLDMRMDTSSGMSAADWLSQIAEEELVKVLKVYGEERFAKRIAHAVIEMRKTQRIETTKQLSALIEKAVPVREKNKHPATRSFQAIRIALNRELDELESVLNQALDVLQVGGRLVVISFHSLEDRIVKRFMREHSCEKNTRLPLLEEFKPKLKRVGKAQMPKEEETNVNVRARSAVLRVAERLP